ILLMTAFDAGVFDLVRIAFRDRFFAMVKVFGNQDKFSLKELGGYSSFEAFRDHVVEAQLKARYLKDLLFTLKELGVRCEDTGGHDLTVRLVELVLRRNVHLHNRGVVDERYLERDQRGKPKYNVY